ncbi:MAG: DUF5004 domain-containing protein [Sphingobacterium sp.]|uniref:DUF5004 domain-containing protein n=1 Tax=Sphingobacterium sp. JB170 TaxID=1434842 RepID=UPI00097F219F|nr:DUF5004 domain-containing protein [Sphingobacterium sp. JB170]SJN47082.1 hypothetical protein FM107_15275 [Sphingobacterium sp. JB170]
MMRIKQLLALIAVSSFLVMSSCEDEISKISSGDEPIKEIAGKWHVVQLSRNGEELSERMDMTNFSIEFKPDGTYSVAEQLPFMLQGSGNYRLNDPQYPFSLLMSAQDDGQELAVSMQYPVVKGERQLSLSFSLGCSGNTYQYNFERE